MDNQYLVLFIIGVALTSGMVGFILGALRGGKIVEDSYKKAKEEVVR